MSEEINELKELVRQNIALSQETSRAVHAMRRNARFATIVRLLYWVAIVAVLGASYYFYVAPYVAKFQQAYASFESGVSKTQQQGNQVQSFFQSLGQSFQKYFPQSTK